MRSLQSLCSILGDSSGLRNVISFKFDIGLIGKEEEGGLDVEARDKNPAQR
jgi:hypothetical protein